MGSVLILLKRQEILGWIWRLGKQIPSHELIRFSRERDIYV